jgi:hypothetical protein
VAQGDEFAEPTLAAPARVTAGLASLALAQNWIYRFGTRLLPTIMSIFKRDGWIPNAPYPLSRWTKARPLPPFTASFRQWWNVRAAKKKDSDQ